MVALYLQDYQRMSQERIDAIKAAIAAADATTPDELEAYRMEYISKKSVVGELFAAMGQIPNEEKRAYGRKNPSCT